MGVARAGLGMGCSGRLQFGRQEQAGPQDNRVLDEVSSAGHGTFLQCKEYMMILSYQMLLQNNDLAAGMSNPPDRLQQRLCRHRLGDKRRGARIRCTRPFRHAWSNVEIAQLTGISPPMVLWPAAGGPSIAILFGITRTRCFRAGSETSEIFELGVHRLGPNGPDKSVPFHLLWRNAGCGYDRPVPWQMSKPPIGPRQAGVESSAQQSSPVPKS